MQFAEITPTRPVPRDGYGRPLIVPEGGGKPVAHIRTTTFVDALEDKSALIDWRARCTMLATLKHPEVVEGALRLDPDDPEDKRTLNRLAERVFDVAGFNDKREKGTAHHLLTEYVDAGIPLPSDTAPEDVDDMAAYLMATVALQVVKVEQMVVVNELPTAGTPDRVSLYHGPGPDGEIMRCHVITDLKTGDISYGQLKIAAQLATYARGKIYDHTVFPAVDVNDKKAFAAWKKTEFDPELAAMAYRPLPDDVSREWGIVINLRPGSGQASLCWVDLTLGWRAALMAKEIRALRSMAGKALIQADSVC